MGVRHLAELCAAKGIKNIIISPGSRNAPIIQAFQQQANIRCLSITDERSAAFFALGMAQQSGEIVAIACTSGTAVLNYSPALAEAYYQKIPLLVLTADRPLEWIDQADSQTIRQQNIYSNYIKKSFQLFQNIQTEDELWYTDRIINEAIEICNNNSPGPVHINLPFPEPLYEGFNKDIPPPKIINTISYNRLLDSNNLDRLSKLWNSCSKKMILVGLLTPNNDISRQIEKLSTDKSVVVLSESTSNIPNSKYISNIDRVLSAIDSNEEEEFLPELLITFGGQIISKKIKEFLRKNKIKQHWHIDSNDLFLDTYKCLSENIPVGINEFLKQFLPLTKSKKSNYYQLWHNLSEQTEIKHKKFLSSCIYSDLKVFDKILNKIPLNSDLHLANSTAVRYTQLFSCRQDINYFSNRGTSGIDGCVSTASGAAFESKKYTTLICGDLSFFYDSNALWNRYLPANLKIVLINNEGGGIFRFIDGPSKCDNFEELFEARHQTSAKHIAATFNLIYSSVNKLREIDEKLDKFFTTKNKCEILEIFTPREMNDKILKEYFNLMKH